MTLSLDEVRNIRFPMVRKPNEDGYRASAVDNFMDKLEISYADLVTEIEKLKADQGQAADNEGLTDEVIALRNANEDLEQAKKYAEEEAESLRAQLDELRASSDVAKTGDEQLRNENEQLRNEAERLRAESDQQRAEVENLRAQLVAATQQVVDAPTAAEITSSNLGTVVDGVQHIEVTTSQQASPAVVRLVELATQQAEDLLNDAKADADKRVSDANNEAARVTHEAQSNAEQKTAEAQATADRLVNDAQNESDRLNREAREQAENLLADARGRAERLDGEVSNRRTELFSQLESERDVLARRVTNLRNYEGAFREALNNHLKNQLQVLEQLNIAPDEAPNMNAMYGLGKTNVSTPRLDALLEESKLEENK